MSSNINSNISSNIPLQNDNLVREFKDDADFAQLSVNSLRDVNTTLKTVSAYEADMLTFTGRDAKLKDRQATILVESVAANKTDENQRKNIPSPTYSTAIISKEKDINAILGNAIRSNPKAEVFYITDFNDLSGRDLIDRHKVDKDKNTGEMTLNKESGLLHDESGNPVILVIDYTCININTIVEFNSLYDHPPKLHGKNLSSNVKIISVVDSNLSDIEGPGRDFWRRVLATKDFINTGDDKYLNSSDFFSDFETEVVKAADEPSYDSENDLIIRLAGENWHNELFGHLDLDDNNNIYYKDGALAKLTKNQSVYFQDPPLGDKNFAIEIEKLNRNGRYFANGKFVELPKGVKFYHCKTNEHKLKNLQDKFKWVFSEGQSDYTQSGKTRTLNEISFFSYVQHAAIKDKTLIKYDVFKDWIGEDTSAIRVTTKLSVTQWHTLLSRLEKLGRTDICIIQDDPDSQPPGWAKRNKLQPENIVNDNIKIVLDDLGFIPNALEKKADEIAPLVVQLSPNSNVSRLTSRIHGVSLKERSFDIESTEFLQALEDGTPIEMYGLDYNPRLICELESLLNNPPSLVVDGFFRAFPKAKINFHLPNNVVLPTSPWKILKENAEKVYTDTLGVIKKKLVEEYYKKAGIDKKLSSEVFNLIEKIVEEANSIPIAGSKLPHSPVVLCEYFFNKIWKQAILEQQLDGTKKINKGHFQKALNSIFAKRYRDEPEQYRYIKCLIERDFSVKSSSLDFIGLQHWIKKQGPITKAVIKDNFWTISDYIPLTDLKLTKSKKIFTRKNFRKIIEVARSLFSNIKKILVVATFNFIIKCKLILDRFLIWLSTVIPWMKTRYKEETLRVEEAKTVSLKDLAATDSEALDFVHKTILSIMEDEQQKLALQNELNISDEAISKHKKVLKKYPNNCYQIEKVLRDICYSVQPSELSDEIRDKIEKHGYQALCHELSMMITKNVIEFEEAKPDKKEEVKKQVTAKIDNLLAMILPGDKNKQARAEFSSELLLCAKQNITKLFWKYWYERRKLRCANRLETHPLVMIKGYAGSGKSYIAKTVAKRLNPNEEPITVNVKADMTAEDVHESFELVDNKITYIKGKLRQWASRSEEGYHTLILDEFTLTRELWDGLKTMGSNPPHINLDGEKIPLTDKHRIVMTSNPDHFQGRKAHKVLTSMTAEMFYFPLAEGFQKQEIIVPEVSKFIDRIKFSTDANIKANAVDKIATSIHEIYLQYSKRIPNYEFTPRDLTDCCSRMETYFSDYITGKNKDTITVEMINAVIRESMKQSVANAIPDELSENVNAIDSWHKARFPGDDKIIQEMETNYDKFCSSFGTFLAQDKSENIQKIDLTNKVTRKLCKTYFTEIQRLLLEVNTGVIHGGRHSILVKSSPGQGKDLLWITILDYFKKSLKVPIKNDSYTANHKSMSEISSQTNIKFKEGGTISVSEFNAYNSQSIEGMLNDLFTDRPLKPGFLFLATINDATETRGRNELSKSLLSRFTQYNIDDYDFDDFKNICKKQLGSNEHIEVITTAHCNVVAAMKKGKKNAVPSLEDIKKVVSKVSEYQSETSEQLLDILVENYSKYLQLLGYDNTKVIEFFKAKQQEDKKEVKKSINIENLTTWINKQKIHTKQDAVTVREGDITSYNVSKGIITLSKEDRDKPETEQQEIIKNKINDRLSGRKETSTAGTENESKIEATGYDGSTVVTGASKNIVVSSNDPINPDVEKLLKSEEGVHRNTGDVANILGNKFINETLEGYFQSSIKKNHEVLIKEITKAVLSENENTIDEWELYRNNYTSSRSLTIPKNVEALKKLAKDSVTELQNNKILEDQHTEKLLEKYNVNKEQVLAILNKIIETKEDHVVKDTNELAVFSLLSEINSPACNTLFCSIITLKESLPWLDSFTYAIASGNINCKTAIALLETNNNAITRMFASRGVLYKCCETLKKGRNMDNISAIVEYIMEKEGDFLDNKTLYSLIKIGEMYQLEDLSNKAKTVVNKRYKKMLSHEIKINVSKQQESRVKLLEKDIPAPATKLLTNTINTNLDKIIKTDIEQVEVSTYKPTSNIDVREWLAGRPPFKDIMTKDAISTDIMIIGAPTYPSLRLAATFYHKPSGKILDLGSFFFDETGLPKFIKNNDVDATAVVELIEEIKEYFANLGIAYDESYNSMLAKIASKLNRLYTIQQGKYDFKVSEMFNGLHCLSHDYHSKELNEYLVENNYSNDIVHIPSTYISRLISEQMLKRTGELKYCLKFSHSSEAGTVTAKSVSGLEIIDQYISETTRDRVFLHLCNNPHDEEQFTELKDFEKREIRNLAMSENLTVLHQQDLENLVSSK